MEVASHQFLQIGCSRGVQTSTGGGKALALHHLAKNIGFQQSRSRCTDHTISIGSDLECIRLIFEDYCRDYCTYLCSPNGCLAVTCYTQQSYRVRIHSSFTSFPLQPLDLT